MSVQGDCERIYIGNFFAAPGLFVSNVPVIRPDKLLRIKTSTRPSSTSRRTIYYLCILSHSSCAARQTLADIVNDIHMSQALFSLYCLTYYDNNVFSHWPRRFSPVLSSHLVKSRGSETPCQNFHIAWTFTGGCRDACQYRNHRRIYIYIYIYIHIYLKSFESDSRVEGFLHFKTTCLHKNLFFCQWGNISDKMTPCSKYKITALYNVANVLYDIKGSSYTCYMGSFYLVHFLVDKTEPMVGQCRPNVILNERFKRDS